MNTYSEETLMAFADGELDPEMSAAVAAAMREDPAIERRVAAHRALRASLQSAYASELEETPPERLLAAARGIAARPLATVSHLADARARVAIRSVTARPRVTPPGWRPFAAMAASLLLGVGLGYFVLKRSDLVVAADGGLVARGVLAKSLSAQVGDDQAAASAITVGMSFKSKDGDYCRVFSVAGAKSQSGLACRQRGEWSVEVLAQNATALQGTASNDAYRTASSELSPAILETVQARIAGEPLDHQGELEARDRGWQTADR